MATDLSQYDPIFQAAGQEWNVNPTLLKAVAGQESGGDLNAVSSKGAQGLMQITPDTQKYLGITDPKDPTQQIYGAAKYLDEGLNREGSPEGALLFYHGGPGWRQAYGPESQAYVPAVTARYAALSQAQTSAAPPASSPTTAPSGASQGATPVIVGDSLASPGGLGGSGVVGAVPGAIRSSVAADARKGTYQGQNVVLSSGASNAPGDMTNVEGQLQLLQNGGAKGVTLLGVGPGIETKAPGTNDALQGLATKYGATFVPLPADQMSPDGVHPTARGYKALRTQLASATPITATDASPAPVTATGPGNAMASDDPLSLLPPAPKPTAGGSAASAAPDDPHPLSLLPPAPQPAGAQAATPPQDGPPEADAPAWMSQGPQGGIVAALQPAPNTTYGSLPLSWAARDDKTGALRFAMPSSIRNPLLDLFSGVGAETTANPDTGQIQYGMSPGANLLLGLGVGMGGRDLQFGPMGPMPAPGIIDTTRLPPLTGVGPLSSQAVARGAVREAGAPVGGTPPSETTPLPSGFVQPQPAATAAPTTATATAAAVPTTSDAAKAISSAYYSTFDKAAQDGGSLTPQATNKFIASIEAAAPPPGIGQAVAGKNAITDLVDRLQPYKDQPMSLQDAQVVDQQLGNLISAEYGRTGVSPIGRQLQGIQQDFRDQLSNPAAGDVAGGQAGLDALAPARKAYAQAMKMDTIERIQQRADMNDNPTTSFRTQIRTLLNNDRMSRGFSDDEKDALRDAANRGVAGTALHILGSRLIPIISGASGGGFVGSAIGATVGYGLNEAARAGENALAARRLQNAYTILGKSVPPNPLQSQ